MRTRRLAAALLLAALAAACSGGHDSPQGSTAFCNAVDRYNTFILNAQRRGKIDAAKELERVSDLARTAPKAIASDAEAWRGALEQVADDPSLKDDPALKKAVDNVNRYANKACGLYSGGEGF
jgi:hypothetical protein